VLIRGEGDEHKAMLSYPVSRRRQRNDRTSQPEGKRVAMAPLREPPRHESPLRVERILMMDYTST
jgi:hypothetical protein